MEASEHVERARSRILGLFEEHHAMTPPELEARVSEAYDPGNAANIDPHHVTTARLALIDEELVVPSVERTRGTSGRQVTTLTLNVPGRATAQSRTAARKRLLTARYNTWAQGSVRHPHGLIGPAGERAMRSALRGVSALAPVEVGYEAASQIWNTPLRGAADSAAYFIPTSATGLPGAPITLMFEMKNVRSWLYPTSAEVYQLLDKAARLQATHPDQPLVPVLCCRRHHITLVYMAKQLGFLAIEMGVQFVGDVEEKPLNEVRKELHHLDLTPGNGPSLRIRDRLRSHTVHAALPGVAARWRETTESTLAPLIAKARSASSTSRVEAVNAIRREAVALGMRGGW